MKPFTLDRFWDFPHAKRYGGGGGDGAQQIASAPIPTASPPVTETSPEVVQAQQDLRRQALKKKGFSQTIFAGDDGGWMPQNNPNPSPTNPKVPSATGGSKTLGG